MYDKVIKANEQNLIESCHDLSDGGLAVAVCESAIGIEFGAELDVSELGELSLNAILFSESHSRFVVSIRPENKVMFEDLFGADAFLIGKVTSNKMMKINFENNCVVDLEMEDLEQSWNDGLK